LPKELLDNFLICDLIHIAKYENLETAELAQMTYEYWISKELTKVIVAEIRILPSIQDRGYNGWCWFGCESKGLQEAVFRLSKRNPNSKDKKLKRKALQYVLLGDVFYGVSMDHY